MPHYARRSQRCLASLERLLRGRCRPSFFGFGFPEGSVALIVAGGRILLL
jgi:hypothetical protein